MIKKKWIALVAAGVLAVALALVGCSSGSSSSSASASGSASASTSASASGSASSEGGIKLVESGVLIFATSPDFPPFENDVNGEFVGYEIDIAQAVGEKLGFEVRFEAMDFDSILAAVASGVKVDAGISGITIDPKRMETVDFSTSYVEDNQSVAVMKGGSITAENAAEELNKEGVVIAVQAGTTGADYAAETFPNATIKEYKNSTDCFADMQAGNVTAVCTNLVVVQRMIDGSYNNAMIVLQDATAEKYGIAVSKDNPELTKAINDAIAELIEDGTMDEIFSRSY